VTQTQVLDKTFVRVLSWYDNEWRFLEPHGRGRRAFRRNALRESRMADIGYDKPLYILPFDHRASFEEGAVRL